MTKQVWTPWHQVARLREDLKTGELSLAMFAADLYDVVMGRGRSVYRDPQEFFALTYPTFNLRELAKDVAIRLAGRSDKAIRQLALTYGGGKTHTLITLFHLVNNPDALPDLPAVQEFAQHIGIKLPRARVAALTFDRLDPVQGMEVKAPDGATAQYKYPWTSLAWQLGGKDGLQILGTVDGEEREEPPFTNVLMELLSLPAKEDRATLILLDEVLMWARTKVGADGVWRHRIQDFFQCLTQAAVKVDRCAIVASLLATDPAKSDTLGKEITNELHAVFRREREEDVQPVGKDDVAEVLRRRFFTPDSIRDPQNFRSHVVAALKGITDLDDQTRKDGKAAEDRFLKSYPFHPDLTEVLYTKWTALEGFQRTRGVLRTFALALRSAEKWDESPLISTNVFLDEPGKNELSEAARELANVATTEEYEGKKQEWMAIIEGELAKAREIQAESTGVRHRELEQAVFATFLHSQPIGQRAQTRDLLLLVGASRPDKIDLEKALRRWADVSWFLDEAETSAGEADAAGQRSLPKYWRLGSRPNLKQMHHDACLRVSAEVVEAKLIEEIHKVKSLTSGAKEAGAKVHLLPEKPHDIEDDGDFHYAVLGPRAWSDSGNPRAEAQRFINITTSDDRPRVYRNAVVLAAPSRDGLDVARARVRDYLGWEEVREQLKGKEVDLLRQKSLQTSLEEARKKLPEAIQQAYCIVVTVSEKNEVQAFKIKVEGIPLFQAIADEPKTRISKTEINAEAMLPEGPYDLWREGEDSRRVKDLAGAFAQFPHLPKMLKRRAILDTIASGCQDGQFVLRSMRPDKSFKTFWMERPDEQTLGDPTLEVVLPEKAVLTEIAARLLTPGRLPGLWTDGTTNVGQLRSYFSGAHVAKINRGEYEEPLQIPRAEDGVIDAALRDAVKEGLIWLTSGPASLFKEDAPEGVLTDDAQLQPPPQALTPVGITVNKLPEAWSDGVASGRSIGDALSAQAGKTLPWTLVREAIESALRTGYLEKSADSGEWPCGLADASRALFRMPQQAQPPVRGTGSLTPIYPVPQPDGRRIAESELDVAGIQNFSDVVSELAQAATKAGCDLKFRLRIELTDGGKLDDEQIEQLNEILKEVAADLQF